MIYHFILDQLINLLNMIMTDFEECPASVRLYLSITDMLFKILFSRTKQPKLKQNYYRRFHHSEGV